MATEVANHSSSVAIAMAFAGRSARACDVCANKGAHWFCAADDAYLCTACDTQVHSANALSLRHERVRLSATGTPMKSSSSSKASSFSKVPKAEPQEPTAGCKKNHASPPQVAPVRKRSRTTRPYSHHLKKLTQVVKSESDHHGPSELELFNFLDADVEFLVPDDGNQEVPCLGVPSSSSELDFLSSPDCDEFDHSASADSFAAVFKSKAVHDSSHSVEPDDGDQFLVPDGVPEDAFFFPGDIPGLSGFDEVDLSDDFSLSFDLALQNNNNNNINNNNNNNNNGSVTEAFEGDDGGKLVATCKVEDDQFTAGPFAKFFATKTKAELMQPMSADRIASQAREILQCCSRGDDDGAVPRLQLNLKDVLAAWSDRGDVWIHGPTGLESDSKDVGIVPDMDAGAQAGDESNQSGADRDARVMRYKEKRRTRLFSKKIRYEVRKLNAERRPRMKGRFVKRTTTTTS